jgi:hypothetical protein
MAYEKPQSSDQGIKKQRGQAMDQGIDSGSSRQGTLADAHGKGIAGTSTHDLIGNLRGTEGTLTSQSGPQPSGGATGMREQLGSFESGQSDTSGAPGEDRHAVTTVPGEEKLPK